MVIEIDFNSDEAIYMQITNQIIMGIATSRLHELWNPVPECLLYGSLQVLRESTCTQ